MTRIPFSDDLEGICPTCNGSGEGYCDNSICYACGGTGVQHYSPDNGLPVELNLPELTDPCNDNCDEDHQGPP